MSDMLTKVAQVDPDAFTGMLKMAEALSDCPFKDEVYSELAELVKMANALQGAGQQAGFFGRMGSSMAQGAGAVGGAAAMGIAYSLAGDMYDSLKRGITKSRDYRVMLEENPDLKSKPAKDVQKAFAVLHRFNPDFASDPTVAGAFVRRQADFPDGSYAGDIGMLKNLVDSRKNMNDSRKLPTVPQMPDFKGKGLQHRVNEMQLSHGPEMHEMNKERHQQGQQAHQMGQETHGMNKERHEWGKADEGRKQNDEGRKQEEEGRRSEKFKMDIADAGRRDESHLMNKNEYMNRQDDRPQDLRMQNLEEQIKELNLQRMLSGGKGGHNP